VTAAAPESPRGPRRVVTVNAGSTSMKVVLLDGDAVVSEFDSLDSVLEGAPPDAVAHRVVHGGSRTRAELVDAGVVRELRALTDLAPLHQPPALDALDRTLRAWPDVPQVACFDTAFHATIPAAAATYALPERLRQKVRVFGFHGLSHAWASGVARRTVPGARRVLVAHLGGGSSLCAVLDGVSVDTTMGFTPLDGLVMATRSGAIDPGALLWLQKHTAEDLDAVLEQESGLLGLCGTSDMREVLVRRQSGDPAAVHAFEVCLHRLVGEVGAMAAALRGLDVLVFTGGVGEHADTVRQTVGQRLGWLGVHLADDGADGPDPDTVGLADQPAVRDLTGPGSAVRTLVVRAREDRQLAAEARAVLLGQRPGPVAASAG
jgi:acetate kinase